LADILGFSIPGAFIIMSIIIGESNEWKKIKFISYIMNEKNILLIYNIISHIIQLILFDLIFPFEFLFVLANKNFRLNYFF
jgi:hypothetical protein